MGLIRRNLKDDRLENQNTKYANDTIFPIHT